MNASDFYNKWANSQITDPRRERILAWKAGRLADMYSHRCGSIPVASITEVGGADGILLNALGRHFPDATLVNYDISSDFCNIGRERFPHIRFVNSDFLNARPEVCDIIVLSDIIEHIDDEKTFLNAITRHCRYVLIKIPIEQCWQRTLHSHLMALKQDPGRKRMEYGPTHRNGHLRGYHPTSATTLVRRHFNILDCSTTDTIDFSEGNTLFARLVRTFCGIPITVRIFGGAFFALGQTQLKRTQP